MIEYSNPEQMEFYANIGTIFIGITNGIALWFAIYFTFKGINIMVKLLKYRKALRNMERFYRVYGASWIDNSPTLQTEKSRLEEDLAIAQKKVAK